VKYAIGEQVCIKVEEYGYKPIYFGPFESRESALRILEGRGWVTRLTRWGHALSVLSGGRIKVAHITQEPQINSADDLISQADMEKLVQEDTKP